MPSYFPENNTPLALDTETKSLQKINSLLESGITVGQVQITGASAPLDVIQKPNTGEPTFFTGSITATSYAVSPNIAANATQSRLYLRIQALEGGSSSAIFYVSFNGTNDHIVLATPTQQTSASTYPFTFSTRSDTVVFENNWVPQTGIWFRVNNATGKPVSVIYV